MATSLLTFEHAFYTGDFFSVVHANIADSERVNELQIRALLALGQTEPALARIHAGQSDVYQAFKVLVSKNRGDLDAVAVQDLSDSAKHLIALKHATLGEYVAALDVLSTTRESLDAALLKVHVLLATNQEAAAQETVRAMRQWANDHVAFNVAEALVSLRRPETAQKAFFIFEENNSMLPAPNSQLGEGVSQATLRRFPEAALPLGEALKGGSEAAIISALALALVQGDLAQAEDLRSKLQLEKYMQSPAVLDLKEKEDAFDRVLAKFSAHA